MRKFFKSIIKAVRRIPKAIKVASVIAISASALVADVKAQGLTYTAGGVFNTSIITNAFSTATNVGLTFGPFRQKSVTLQIEVMGDANGAATYGFHYRLNTDGSTNYPALNSLLIAFNGVTKQTVTTNINLQGNGFINIPYITNSHASINGTNIVIRAPLNYNAP